MSQSLPRGVIALLGLLVAGAAGAQVSGSVTLVSDYRYRGVSLSDENPAAQFSVAYDHSSGWYAGVFGSTTQLANQSGRNPQLFSYLGYMRRMRSGLNWEVGTGYSAFAGYHDDDYPEVYWGIASDNLSGRIYYASNYFGQSTSMLYAELNGSRPLSGRFRLLGHIGVLHRNNTSATSGESGHYQYDVRAGISIDLNSTRIELTAVTTDSDSTVYPVSGTQKRHALVMSLSRSF